MGFLKGIGSFKKGGGLWFKKGVGRLIEGKWEMVEMRRGEGFFEGGGRRESKGGRGGA